MGTVDIIKSSLDSIRQISEHVEGAVLYLDAGCTESFQYLGAFPLLLELGVHTVCSLENVSTLDMVVDGNATPDHSRNIVIITSRLLSDAHRYILRCLSTHEDVHSCKIFTSISEIAHSAYPDSPLGPDAYREYESFLVQDYEEIVKKSGTRLRRSVEGPAQEKMTDDEGLSQFSYVNEEINHTESSLKERESYPETPTVYREDTGQELIVSVQHFPMIMCPFSPRIFVLPSEGSVAEAYISIKHEDSLSSGLPPISTGMAYDGDDVPGITLTAHFLYHLATKMDLKLEIFFLGNLSKSVGKTLTDMSSLYDVGRRKRSAGLLLIDRTLDLLTPCCHGDSLVDRMFSSLPRKERTTSFSHMKGSQTQLNVPAIVQHASLDLQIPIASILSEEDPEARNFRLLENIEAFLCGWKSSDDDSQILDLSNLSTKIHGEESLHSEINQLSGSLIAGESFRGTPYLEALFDRRTKDGTILVKKWLQESLRKESISSNVRTRPGVATKSELQSMIKALAKSQSSSLRNKGIIQLGAATVFALDESYSARWDGFISAEKMLAISAGDTSQSLAAQIRDIISTSIGSKQSTINKGLLSFQDALLLTITGYILAGENFPTSGSNGPFSWQEEHFLKEAIVDAVLGNPVAEKLKFLRGLTEELEVNLKNASSEETKEGSLEKLEDNDFDDDDQWGKWDDEENDDSPKNKEHVYDNMQLKLELRDRVDNFFRFLHKLSSLRSRDVLYREGTLASESDTNDDPNRRKSLLYNVLKRVLGKYDVPGLEYHSSTVGRLFKSGFGRFGIGQAKPNLGDQSVILVFVIGGINSVEVHEAHEALSESERPDVDLILGGTTLLTPDNMLDLLLGNPGYI